MTPLQDLSVNQPQIDTFQEAIAERIVYGEETSNDLVGQLDVLHDPSLGMAIRVDQFSVSFEPIVRE